MTFLTIIIFILWSVAIIKGTLFWIYFWQTKEYRYDRMRVHFELPTSKELLLNRRNIWLGVLLLLIMVPINPIRILSVLALTFLYLFFTARTAQQFQARTIKVPKLTMRALLVMLFGLFVYTGLSVIVFLYLNSFLIPWFIVGDIILPVIIGLGVLATSPFTTKLKDLIIKRATKRREHFKDLLVIGITGSYGKTSTKEILYSLLKQSFRVLKTPANINVDVGVANLILKKLSPQHDIFIVEMGAYKKGEIKKMAEMAKPNIGILTGVNPQHISLFGSLQNIQEAKYELIESLPEKGLAVFNGDNENVKTLFRQCKKTKRVYSMGNYYDDDYQKIFVESFKNTKNGLEIEIREKNYDPVVLKTKLLGKHNVLNILGAVTVARELGMKYPEIKSALEAMDAPAHTLRLKRGIKDSVVIDDAYAANEDGVLAALDVLKNMEGNKKLCILQPLIELGDSAERVHKNIAENLAQVCDYVILTSRDYFSVIYKEAVDAGMSKDTIFCLPKPQEALRKAQELINKDDAVLIENRVPEAVLNGMILHQ